MFPSCVKQLNNQATEKPYWNVVAVWWGYETQNEVLRKNAIDNIKEALEKIRVRIGRDAAEIKAKLAE